MPLGGIQKHEVVECAGAQNKPITVEDLDITFGARANGVKELSAPSWIFPGLEHLFRAPCSAHARSARACGMILLKGPEVATLHT